MDTLTTLKSSVITKDADEVEDALVGVMQEERTEKEYVHLLIALLEADWHFRHEDVARELQRLRDPLAISSLRRVAERKFDYLEYNDSQALARKCTWALSDIGTNEARVALEEIASLPDQVVSGYAKKCLDR